MMNDDLFRGTLVRLAATNAETDAETIAGWTRDPEFQHMLVTDVPRPWTARGVKADFLEGQNDDRHHAHDFSFAIRTLEGDVLIGFTDVEVNHWPQRNGWVAIGIGPREYWGKGYGTDAMRVLMRYAFTELNLARVSVNSVLLRLLDSDTARPRTGQFL
jgi:RimJ/RimL family protein N-acetyltransferase